jgi:hypothetical protein
MAQAIASVTKVMLAEYHSATCEATNDIHAETYQVTKKKVEWCANNKHFSGHSFFLISFSDDRYYIQHPLSAVHHICTVM